MPYADPEKRRQYQREYKRRWRKKQEKINPLRGFKVYICPRAPGASVGLASFVGGFLITDRPAVQRQIQRHPEFGVHIFPLALDLTLTTTEEE